MLAKFPNWNEVVGADLIVFLCPFLSVSVRQLHREFLRAGSDVMQTFTFYASDDKLENRGNTQRFTVSERTIFTPSCDCSCSRNVIFTFLSWGRGGWQLEDEPWLWIRSTTGNLHKDARGGGDRKGVEHRNLSRWRVSANGFRVSC